MKRIFTLLTIIVSFHLLSAQETYRFRTDMPQGPNIESSTAFGLSLHYILNEITVADYNHGDDKGQEILMKGSFGSFAEGLPNLPFENHYIAVPHGAKVSVKVKENGCQTLNGIDLLPAAEVILNNAAEQPKLRKDMSVFGKDANFPSENVTIAQATQIRGLDVVMLNITPFRYNPVRKTLEVIYDMDIEISFEGGNGLFGDVRYLNPAWDGILRDLVINSNILPKAHYYERLNEAIQNREEGCEYLIITIDDSAFMAWADTLKQFRTKQGILTKVATTADCGSNEPEDIRNYILNAYESWSIPPAAVLLFGGNHVTNAEFGLKPYLLTSPPSYNTYTYPTDNPFADMNGDSIPDLAISRMTVLNADDCQLQVEKLIDYELNPPTDSHYYDHPVINSGYQDTKWFAITAQVTNNFLRDKLGKHPANIYMKYYYEDGDPTPPDSIWSVAPNTDAVLDYFGQNGAQYILSSIGYLNDWIDMRNKLPFQNAVNEGGFLTFYRDHSNPDWWGCSDIRPVDIASYINESPTFLFSIGCSTNNYWDDWSYTGCIADRFLHAETGAIGSLGANTVTYSHYNDITTWGMFDYLWPDYMPTLGSQTEPDFPYPSYSLVAGKLFLRQQTFLPYTTDTVKVEKTLNLFSYLGETYLSLYTEMPQPLAIDAPVFHTNDQWQYTFTAEEGTTICLSNNNGIIAVVRATGETQSLMLPQMEVGEQFTLTATKKNRFRYEKTITIISSEHSFVYAKAIALNDQDGNGQLDYGESASFDLLLQNAGLIASQGATIQLLCDSPYVQILQSITTYPTIESNAEYSLHNTFQIRLTHDVPDQTHLRFQIHFDEGENTHTDALTIEANAPVLYIEPEYRPMTAEGEPSTHIATEGKSKIAITVVNKGHSAASLLLVSLDIKAPFVEIEFPQKQLESLAPNESHNFTFELNTNPNDITGAWLQSHFNIQHLEHNVWLDTIVQYGGIFESFETDTLNQAYSWPPGPNGFWSYHDNAYEGQRCLRFTLEDHYGQLYTVTARAPYQVNHDCKTSFRYKTDRSDFFSVSINGKTNYLTASDTWAYMETLATVKHQRVVWRLDLTNSEPIGDTLIAYIDDICFPPPHTTIAFAGSELLSCGENPVELSKAYAYDCNSILWVTDGDGHFDCDTVATPFYTPGSQDMENGSVTLTLKAYGNDTIISTTAIHFMEEINLGEIVGDSVVNKYEHPISHYRVDNPEGLNLIWELDPANAGYIYGFGDAVDILWDQSQGDIEANLHVFTNYDCTALDKHISLIGYSTPEWHETSFELFPNPTDGKVNLVVGETLQGKAIIEVYNLLGEQMIAKKVSHLQKGETYTLDLSHLVSGLYIIKMSTENGSCSKKVSVR